VQIRCFKTEAKYVDGRAAPNDTSRWQGLSTSAYVYKYQLATHLDRMIKQFSIIFSV